MKEFSDNIIIGFDFKGRRIRQRIDAARVVVNADTRVWAFQFKRDQDQFIAFGSIDEDGDFRTSGPIDKKGTCSVFYVEVLSLTDDNIIDEIDVETVDVRMIPETAYITVRVDFEYEEDADLQEVRQEIANAIARGLPLPDGSAVRNVSTDVCGINEE